jgi:O-antigen/teichoic acid export membrane protein
MSQVLTYILKKSPFLNRFKEKLAESPVAYRIAKGTFWSLIGAVGSKALTLVSSIVIARILGKEGYGEVGMVQSTIGLFGVFAGFGLGTASTKYIAEYRTKDPEKAGRILNLTLVVSLISGGIMAIVCLAMSPWLAENTLNRSDLASLLGASALLLFISTLGGVLFSALSGFESFRAIARINIWQGAVSPLVAIPCVWFYGVQGAIASFTINAAIGLILCTIALRAECKSYRIPQTFDTSFLSERYTIWKFSLPAMFAALMVGPAYWICSIILVNQKNGYSEMGIFTVVNQWFMHLLLLPSIIGQVIFPILSESIGANDINYSNKILMLSIKLNAALILPIVFILCFLSPFIMQLYGKSFSEEWLTLIIGLLTAGLLAIQTPIGNIIAASGRMWVGFFMNLGWAIAFIGFSIAFVKWGALGINSARAIAYLIHAIWTFGFAYLIIKKNNNVTTSKTYIRS